MRLRFRAEVSSRVSWLALSSLERKGGVECISLSLITYLVPGLSRITWVFYPSARRLLRERIIDDTSCYQALHLHFHIRRRLQHALASVSLSRLVRAPIFQRVNECVLVYCRPCIHLGGEENSAL